MIHKDIAFKLKSAQTFRTIQYIMNTKTNTIQIAEKCITYTYTYTIYNLHLHLHSHEIRWEIGIKTTIKN